MGIFDQILDPRRTAVDLFTNRIAERATFTRSIYQHLERLAQGTATLDNHVDKYV
jgi:hypothetical protein